MITTLSRLGAGLGVGVLGLAAVAALLLTPRAAHPLAAPAAAIVRPPQPPAPASCSSTLQSFAAIGPGIDQHPDGSLTGCIKIGQLKPGTYDLQLVAPPGKQWSVVGAQGGPLQLQPAAGPPGTRVMLSGEVPPALVPTNREAGYLDHALACWGDCAAGQTQWVQVNWSTTRRGAFEAVFLVPPGPWWADGGHRPDPGRYRIQLPCMPNLSDKRASTCSGLSMGGDFDLRKPDRTPGCWDPKTCTWLRMSATTVTSGDVVAVDGWAPIRYLAVTGTPDPWTSAYYLNYSGEPRSGPSAAALALMRFTVVAGPDFASLGSLKPAWEQTGGEQALAVSPDGTRLAYCAADGIRVSRDGGGTWSTASTAGLLKAQRGQGVPVCQSVVLDPVLPGSLYVRYAAPPAGAAPPASIGAVTAGLGATWRPIPVPSPELMFGGFQPDSRGVDALFATLQPTVVRTTDGGVSWQPAQLSCPGSGSCARLASDLEGSCAKGQSWQGLQLSADAGRTWTAAPRMDRITTCSPLHLAGLPDGRLILLSGGEEPFLVSSDRGQRWHAADLPAPNPQMSSLQILPDGSLLGTGLTNLLPAGSRTWCAAPDLQTPAVVAAGRLWWRPAPTGAEPASDGVRSMPLTEVRCQ